MSSTTTATNRNNTSLTRRNINNHLIKSSSTTNIQESIKDNFLQKVSSFKFKTRNHEKKILKSNNSEKDYKNIKYSFNYSFHNINVGEKNKNIFKINNNKNLKNCFQRKKKTNENTKFKLKKNLNQTFFPQHFNKYSNKNFSFKVIEIERNKLFNTKKSVSKLKSVKQFIKLNKDKSKSNLEFENIFQKKFKNSMFKKIRCSSLVLNERNKKKIEYSNSKILNISLSNNNLEKLKKKYNLNINNTSFNRIINDINIEKDLEGPEHIHFLLVDLIQKGKKKMNELSSKFNEQC